MVMLYQSLDVINLSLSLLPTSSGLGVPCLPDTSLGHCHLLSLTQVSYLLVREDLHDLSDLDHTVYLWVDHALGNIKEEKNIKIRNINEEEWMNEDLLED